MALDINQLKAAFSKKSEGSENTGFWDKFYPFYKMDFDAVVTFRFLPDADDENPLGFIVENKYHELTINGQKKRIACLKMFGESCPCCEQSTKYYNEGDQTMGKKFWRKIDYIAQGLIVNSPFEYEIKSDDNPVRLLSLGPKIYKKIENAIVKGDLENMPYDLQEGHDFRIEKSRQGDYADYSNSSFRPKPTAISEEMLARIKLYNLKDFRFAKVEREQMETMIEAFLTGRALEEKSPDAPKTPAQSADAAVNAVKSAEAPASAPSAAPAAASAAPAASGEKKLSPQEILAKLKSRNQS